LTVSAKETAARLYELIPKGDIEGIVALMDPNIEWTEAAGFPYAGTYHGPQAVLENVLGRIGSEWDGFRADLERIVGDGDHAVGVGTYSGTYKATGKSFSARFAHAYEVKDSKITRFEQIVDSAEVQKAL
jgi:ketosteroid isomerase-like protein